MGASFTREDSISVVLIKADTKAKKADMNICAHVVARLAWKKVDRAQHGGPKTGTAASAGKGDLVDAHKVLSS